MADLNLYVVNEASGNPADWSQWSEWSLVLAATPQDALNMVPVNDGKVAAVDVTAPVVLVSMPEPAWGDDL